MKQVLVIQYGSMLKRGTRGELPTAESRVQLPCRRKRGCGEAIRRALSGVMVDEVLKQLDEAGQGRSDQSLNQGRSCRGSRTEATGNRRYPDGLTSRLTRLRRLRRTRRDRSYSAPGGVRERVVEEG